MLDILGKMQYHLGMKTYRVFYFEPSYTDIEAESEEKARELFLSGEFDETNLDSEVSPGEPERIIELQQETEGD